MKKRPFVSLSMFAWFWYCGLHVGKEKSVQAVEGEKKRSAQLAVGEEILPDATSAKDAERTFLKIPTSGGYGLDDTLASKIFPPSDEFFISRSDDLFFGAFMDFGKWSYPREPST